MYNKRGDNMHIKAKYQYTHFLYPFVIENGNYACFIESILKKTKEWSLNLHQYKNDEESYDFFLPYMRKFLFPTLFWDKDYIKKFKKQGVFKRALDLSKISSVTFKYNMSRIKKGSITDYDGTSIDFEISDIRIICFEGGICFIDFKTQIDEKNEFIDFNKILDFNHYFRNLTPRMKSNSINKISENSKTINIPKFIKDITAEYESKSLDKMYYDKMFTYSYVCVDSWEKPSDFEKMENDFYKFQYVMHSKSSAIFNKECENLKNNRYSRWQYSMFGFSKESGVVFVSDKEKYDITRMPYNFEKRYIYMVLISLYQRISLINFSQDLMRQDKTAVKSLKKKLTKFTNSSWFGQVTNSEHGMDIWKIWQHAFNLPELYDEVHKEYLEYYDFVVSNGQSRINTILMLVYIVSVIFAGIPILNDVIKLKNIEIYTIIAIALCALSYPLYLILSWIKHKLEIKF